MKIPTCRLANEISDKRLKIHFSQIKRISLDILDWYRHTCTCTHTDTRYGECSENQTMKIFSTLNDIHFLHLYDAEDQRLL